MCERIIAVVRLEREKRRAAVLPLPLSGCLCLSLSTKRFIGEGDEQRWDGGASGRQGYAKGPPNLHPLPKYPHDPWLAMSFCCVVAAVIKSQDV